MRPLPTHELEVIHWSVRRWSSQYTLHLGAVAEELVLDWRDLDESTELLELLWKDKANRTMDKKRRHTELEKQIAALSNHGGIDGDRGEQALTIVSETDDGMVNNKGTPSYRTQISRMVLAAAFHRRLDRASHLSPKEVKIPGCFRAV